MNFNELDDVLEVQETEDNGLLRQNYNVGHRFDRFDKWDDVKFYERYRISKEIVMFVLSFIENEIRHHTYRNHAISPLQQLLVALRLYAGGSFQIGLNRSTAGQIAKRVTAALVRHRSQYINIPASQEEKI